ncbi:AbrB/MazE/SpoVT family DNA-binding domain-containing protein [Patescibacteria group bacterium]|nr:AbrB/MazE/SpoVT family DNA-binding domain-containing protein [Patescibacteria group bacterium]
MNKTATITGKRQITIPIKLFKAANLDKNKKVVISQEKNRLIITSAISLVENLAGSLKMPASWQGKDLEEIIEQSKTDYFAKNNK